MAIYKTGGRAYGEFDIKDLWGGIAYHSGYIQYSTEETFTTNTYILDSEASITHYKDIKVGDLVQIGQEDHPNDQRIMKVSRIFLKQEKGFRDTVVYQMLNPEHPNSYQFTEKDLDAFFFLRENFKKL